MSMVSQKRVLVLNKSWQPIRVWTVKKAVKKVFDERARIIDPTRDFALYNWEDWSAILPTDRDATIKGTRMYFRTPEVVLLNDYDKVPQRTVRFNRRNLFKRDKGCCRYCGSKTRDWTIDHIIPKSQGGKGTWENCCIACYKCNSHKADRTPKQAHMTFFQKGWKAKKPAYSLEFHCDVKIESWKHFLSEAYWNVELDED